MNIHLSTDCFNEIDRFLKFCYDGILEVDDSWTPYPHADCLVPLYKFADYMQCDSLRQLILDYWENQLENGLAYANIIFYGLEAGDEECIKAANERLPVKRSPLFADHIESWLDDGSSAMLEALSLLLYHPFSKEKNIINDVEFEGHILAALGEYLAEMTRSARGKIPIDIFAELLTRFLPGTISETDFAALILDYVEDNDISSPFHVQSLLSIVDFSAIPKHQLLNWLLPNIEKFEKISPFFSSTIKDLASLSGAVKLRCDYSKKVLNQNDLFLSLDCGCVLDYSIAAYLSQKRNRNNFVCRKRCCQPAFHMSKKGSKAFEKELQAKLDEMSDNSVQSRAINMYLSKKIDKSLALKNTMQSEEFKQLPSKKKSSRKRNVPEVSPPKVIRFLDQTASIGEDTYVYIAVDEAADMKCVLDKFAFTKVEQDSFKNNYHANGIIYLVGIRYAISNEGRFVRFFVCETWERNLSTQDTNIEKWDFTHDEIIARWKSWVNYS